MISYSYTGTNRISFVEENCYDTQLLKTILELQKLNITALQIDEWLTEKLNDIRKQRGLTHP